MMSASGQWYHGHGSNRCSKDTREMHEAMKLRLEREQAGDEQDVLQLVPPHQQETALGEAASE